MITSDLGHPQRTTVTIQFNLDGTISFPIQSDVEAINLHVYPSGRQYDKILHPDGFRIRAGNIYREGVLLRYSENDHRGWEIISDDKT